LQFISVLSTLICIIQIFYLSLYRAYKTSHFVKFSLKTNNPSLFRFRLAKGWN
jgi:hypothetical protein